MTSATKRLAATLFGAATLATLVPAGHAFAGGFVNTPGVAGIVGQGGVGLKQAPRLPQPIPHLGGLPDEGHRHVRFGNYSYNYDYNYGYGGGHDCHYVFRFWRIVRICPPYASDYN